MESLSVLRMHRASERSCATGSAAIDSRSSEKTFSAAHRHRHRHGSLPLPCLRQDRGLRLCREAPFLGGADRRFWQGRVRRQGERQEGRRRAGVALLAQAGGGQGREADQGAGAARVRAERARPREPGLPPPQRQADPERARRPRPLHQQGVQREPGQADRDHGGDLHPHPARAGAQRRPLRGHLQHLLRRLRTPHRAGPIPHLRGVLPRRHRRLRRLRGRLRAGQAQPDRIPLQDLLHLLPQGHPGPAQGAALHASAAVTHRRAHAGSQGHRAARMPQQLHQLVATTASVPAGAHHELRVFLMMYG